MYTRGYFRSLRDLGCESLVWDILGEPPEVSEVPRNLVCVLFQRGFPRFHFNVLGFLDSWKFLEGLGINLRRFPRIYKRIVYMTREEFIQVLDEKGCSYRIFGDKIVVTHNDDVKFKTLRTLPSGVVFDNKGDVNFGSLETLPSGVEFRNRGCVSLGSLKILPPGVEFRNVGWVYSESLKSISPGVEFKNNGDVIFKSIFGWLRDWNGNVPGIRDNSLLNLMIRKGMFL